MDCGCDYCVEYLEGMVRAQLKDTGFRLPQCCGRVFEWEEELQELIDPKLAEAFEKKRLDFENTIPVYCADKTCPGSSALIASEHHSTDDEIATCPACGKVVCTKCKQGFHPYRKCVADAAEEKTLALAKGKKWQRCSRCGELIEREGDGCSDMK